MMKVRIILFFILWFTPGYIFALELSLPEYKSIAPGVWYGEVKEKDPPVIYHVIKVDLNVDRVAIRPLRPMESETLGQTVSRIDSERFSLVGAITGDYYLRLIDYKLIVPWGILVEDGRLLFSPTGKSALCYNAEKKFHISVPTMAARIWNRTDSSEVSVTAVNRQIRSGETQCGIYNSIWGAFAPDFPQGFAITVTGDSEFRLDRPIKGMVTGISRLPLKASIPQGGFVIIMEKPHLPDLLKLGSQVIVNIEVSSSPENAIGGGPRILREGKVRIELSQENFGVGKAFYIKNSRHPRSAVGIDRDEKTMFLVVVEGRSAESQGMNMKELAKLLLSLGATEAMAFDGGRSVSMYAAGKEVVKGDRQMADALGVFQIKP